MIIKNADNSVQADPPNKNFLAWNLGICILTSTFPDLSALIA